MSRRKPVTPAELEFYRKRDERIRESVRREWQRRLKEGTKPLMRQIFEEVGLRYKLAGSTVQDLCYKSHCRKYQQ